MTVPQRWDAITGVPRNRVADLAELVEATEQQEFEWHLAAQDDRCQPCAERHRPADCRWCSPWGRVA